MRYVLIFLALYAIVGTIEYNTIVEEQSVDITIIDPLITDSDVGCTDDCLDSEPEYLFYSILSTQGE